MYLQVDLQNILYISHFWDTSLMKIKNLILKGNIREENKILNNITSQFIMPAVTEARELKNLKTIKQKNKADIFSLTKGQG